MKTLLVAESREGRLLNASYELIAFADELGTDKVMILVGDDGDLPKFDGKLYLADAGTFGEYNPDAHKKLTLDVAASPTIRSLQIFLSTKFT